MREELKNFCISKKFPINVVEDYNKFTVHSGINSNKIQLNLSQKKKIQKYASFFFDNFYKK